MLLSPGELKELSLRIDTYQFTICNYTDIDYCPQTPAYSINESNPKTSRLELKNKKRIIETIQGYLTKIADKIKN